MEVCANKHIKMDSNSVSDFCMCVVQDMNLKSAFKIFKMCKTFCPLPTRLSIDNWLSILNYFCYYYSQVLLSFQWFQKDTVLKVGQQHHSALPVLRTPDGKTERKGTATLQIDAVKNSSVSTDGRKAGTPRRGVKEVEVISRICT